MYSQHGSCLANSIQSTSVGPLSTAELGRSPPILVLDPESMLCACLRNTYMLHTACKQQQMQAIGSVLGISIRVIFLLQKVV